MTRFTETLNHSDESKQEISSRSFQATSVRVATNGQVIYLRGGFQVSFPSSDRIAIQNREIFADPQGGLARRFIERSFSAAEVESVGSRRYRPRSLFTPMEPAVGS